MNPYDNDKLADYDCKKITQALNYLLQKSPAASIRKVPLVKLLWAADRYHLRKFGRTVTEDRYVAMENGPVSSMAKDILKRKTGYGLPEECLPYIDSYIATDDDNVVRSLRATDMDYLSKTDIDALDFAWNQLGSLASDEDKIVKFTHKYPEWLNYEDSLKQSSVQDIDMDMFFEDTTLLTSDPFALDAKRKQISKEMFDQSSHITALLKR
jgi:uncharacterized phage-associated protein